MIAFLVFYRALDSAFLLWDDPINITENEHIRGLTRENLRWTFGEMAYVRRYMPLGWLGWTVNYALTGLHPLAFHAGNLLFHGANTVLVFLLLRRLLSFLTPTPASRAPERAVLFSAAIGALLWSIHPLRAEPVAWASARIYDQAFFFAFVSVLCYLRFAGSAEQTRSRWLFFWSAVLAYLASLLTYPVALTFGVIPLLLDFYPFRRLPQNSATGHPSTIRILMEKIPFLLLLIAVLGLTLGGRIQATGNFDPPATLHEFGLFARIMQSFYVWAYYVWKPWLPVGLSPHYNALILFNPAEGRFILSAALVLAVTATALGLRRRWPMLLTLWLCHLILLVPLLGLTENVHVTGDRYSYGIGVLWSVLIAAGLVRIWMWPALRVTVIAVCFVVAATLAVLTVRQTRIWHDSETLYRHTLAQVGDAPLSEYLHARLAHALFQKGRLAEALAEYSAALRLNPDLPEAHEGMAVTLGTLGRTSEAIAHYRAALGGKTDLPASLNNLAWILATHPDAKVRQGTEAVALAERACALTQYRKPTLIGTLAAAYAEAGRFSDAVDAAKRAEALAAATGDTATAARNRELLELYRKNQPYREPAVTPQ